MSADKPLFPNTPIRVGNTLDLAEPGGSSCCGGSHHPNDAHDGGAAADAGKAIDPVCRPWVMLPGWWIHATFSFLTVSLLISVSGLKRQAFELR